MSVYDWLNLIGSIGLVATGSILGSLVTILIKHFLDKGKMEDERRSNLEKEIYFNLQKAAESFYKNLNLLRIQALEIATVMATGKFEHTITSIEFEKKLTDISTVQVYFSKDTCNLWDKCSESFTKIADMYFMSKSSPPVTEAQRAVFREAYKILDTDVEALRSAISDELAKSKNRIIK
jgi:hypothetical protein